MLTAKHTIDSLLARLNSFTEKQQRLPNTHKTKKSLIRVGLLKNECAICHNNGIWLDQTLSLHLDHIDGNPRNNHISNLRLLCPNCHSQTETYCGKNVNRQREKNRCLDCGVLLKTSWSSRCISCFNASRNKTFVNRKRQTKIQWPNSEDLLRLIKDNSLEKVGEILGVSSNSVRKHCKRYNIDWQSAKYFRDTA